MIKYRHNYPLDPSDIVRVFESSGIQRPTTDLRRITRMFQNANLVLSAWADRRLVGVCRAVTDFSYCCYLSDLAVEREFQKRGIGRTLIERLRSVIGEEVTLIVVSAPSTVGYYPNVGFEPIQNGYIITRQR
jgi:predicted N-acetyltransferase YhbS